MPDTAQGGAGVLVDGDLLICAHRLALTCCTESVAVSTLTGDHLEDYANERLCGSQWKRLSITVSMLANVTITTYTLCLVKMFGLQLSQ